MMRTSTRVVAAAAVATMLLSACSEEEDPLTSAQREGRDLYRHATFDGNGRTCESCHMRQNGTLTVEASMRRFERGDDALFAPIDADRSGPTYERLRQHATILARIPLADNISIVGSHERSVVVPRGIPSTMNTPALDPVLMSDGRAPDLQSQALDAINTHLVPGSSPSRAELVAIAEFELTLFNRDALREYAAGGPVPELPMGTTEEEIRGRRFFALEGEPVGAHAENHCGHCHAGPMLNEGSGFSPRAPFAVRFFSVHVSAINAMDNPVYRFDLGDGRPIVVSPDPGRALITGDRDDVGRFRTPSLWGVLETPPYFHDNSAKTLDDVVKHYDTFFDRVTDGEVRLSERDQKDIVAFLKLL